MAGLWYAIVTASTRAKICRASSAAAIRSIVSSSPARVMAAGPFTAASEMRCSVPASSGAISS